MQFKHTFAQVAASFDDPNLVSAAGVVPVMRLGEVAGLSGLAQKHLSIPGDKGSNAGAKVASLVAGMVSGADSIDDMNVLRHGGMKRLFGSVYAPSTLGSFLRSFTFGHVRQLDAVASRFLTGLATSSASLLPVDTGAGERVMVDIDDSVIGVHGYQKEGASRGYTGVKGLNSLIATASTSHAAPIIVAQRLRKGSASSARGAARLVADAITTTKRVTATQHPHKQARMLFRADSAYYAHSAIQAARKGGAEVSVTVRMNPSIRAAIEQIPADAWAEIIYPNVLRDETTGELIREAEVAEIDYTAFSSKKAKKQKAGKRKGQEIPFTGPVTGRLVVRRVKELNPKDTEHPTLFDTWRFHAFFTTLTQDETDTVTADKTHRQHAIIEQVHADLKSSALAHLPSGKFAANSAWLTLASMTFNLVRAAATIADPNGRLQKATTHTIGRTLINVAARIASSARRITLHLPDHWPWETAWLRLHAHAGTPPATT